MKIIPKLLIEVHLNQCHAKCIKLKTSFFYCIVSLLFHYPNDARKVSIKPQKLKANVNNHLDRLHYKDITYRAASTAYPPWWIIVT